MADAHFLAPLLRAADVAELSAWGSTPRRALERGLGGLACFTTCFDGEPIAMFGVSPPPTWLGASLMGGGPRCGWMLASCAVEEERRFHRPFWVASKRITKALLADWGPLTNAVSADNVTACSWLQRLGAVFTHTLAVNGHGFFVFTLGR